MDANLQENVMENVPSEAPVQGPVASDQVVSLGTPNEVVVVEPYIVGGDTYAAYGIEYGTISSTYLEYFSGIVEKLKPSEHYVVWKSGDNSYSIAYGKSLEAYPDLVSGYDLECVRILRDRNAVYDGWKTHKEFLSNLELRTTDMFVYSDLNYYPTIKKGASANETLSITFAVCVCLVFYLLNCIFNSIKR